MLCCITPIVIQFQWLRRLFTDREMNIFVHLFLLLATIFLLDACQTFQNDINSTSVINKQIYDCVEDARILSREKRRSRARWRRRRRKRFRCRIRLFSPKCRRPKKNRRYNYSWKVPFTSWRIAGFALQLLALFSRIIEVCWNIPKFSTMVMTGLKFISYPC